MTRRLLVLALVALPLVVCAQAPMPGNCELGRAENDLDVGDVFARAFNTGSLFFGNTSQAAYLVPRHTGRSPMFAAGIWVGGLAAGELRVAGATYANFEFWPGPVDPASGRPPDPADCSGYDRIWRVSRADLEAFYRTGQSTSDLAEWPYSLGAPVLDGDGNPANYDLAAGDQPAISGDQTLWWAMNDVGNNHAFTEVSPIGLEVHVTAFAFANGPPSLRQATFYRYRLVNRSTLALDSAYVGFFADPDLGDAADDWVGSDTLRDLGFVLNADNQDGTGSGGTYGLAPPAFGVQIVQGPVALANGRDEDDDGEVDEVGERAGLTAFIGIPNGIAYPLTDPTSGEEMYEWMRGRWVDGTPVTMGGSGLNPGSSNVTTFVYPGDPVSNAYWSERCPASPTNCGAAHPGGSRRFFLSTGPFRLDGGGIEEILYGLVFAQGDDNLHSVSELRRAAAVVRNAYEAGYLDPRPVPGFAGPLAPPAVQIRRPAPNPFGESATIAVTLPAEAGVRIALVDVLGREVATLAQGRLEAGRHDVPVDGASLAPGTYVARFWVNGEAVEALVLTRR